MLPGEIIAPFGESMTQQNETNKDLVREYYDLSLNKGKPEEATKKFLGPYYRQHNPGAADGASAFINFVHGFRRAYPELRFEFKRFIADGDLVAVHSHLVRQPGDRGIAVMDIFRIESGKIVEHWDVLQDIPEHAENNNTMF